MKNKKVSKKGKKKNNVNSFLDFYEKIRLDLFMIVFTFIGTAIYTLGIVWFLDSNRLFSGGIVGVSQIVTAITDMIGVQFHINFGLVNFLLNVPLILLAFKFLNRKYAIYSTFSIVVQSIIIIGNPWGIADYNTIAWVAENFIGTIGKNEIQDVGKVLSAAMIGGVFVGFGSGLTMKFGSSTAGLDILAQYYSFKKDRSVGGFFLLFNGFIILLAFITLSPALAVFTLVRQIVSTITLDRIHTSYNYVKLEVLSKSGDEISRQLLTLTGRGITKTIVSGAYSDAKIVKLSIVCSSYELHDILDVIYNIDTKAFTTTSNVARQYGSFNKRLIGSRH